ncbi:MAG: glycosyltransferase, partial [Saprospiraceae bacterium]|nr:glycosyltransferase [Saprospiraceae bacterium]
WVDDIRTSYVSGRIFVAPMWSGTGQQNKILEAMALGIPCITTQLVNNAIGAQPGKEILIAESATEFANAIQLLLKDQALYHTVSTQSSKFVQQKFDWKQNATILSSIFASN